MDIRSVVYGGVLGALCTFLGAVAIDWLGRRRDAAATFYAAFLPSLMRLEKGEDIDTNEIIAATNFHRY